MVNTSIALPPATHIQLRTSLPAATAEHEQRLLDLQLEQAEYCVWLFLLNSPLPSLLFILQLL